MTSGLLILALCLSQADAPPPPPSDPPLVAAPEDGVAVPPPAPVQESLSEPSRYQVQERQPVEPPEPAIEPAPGTPTAWWKRSLVTFGIGAGVGVGLGALAAVVGWQTICSNGVCAGSDLFGIFVLASLTATFTIPAAISIVGRALGGRAKYGYALMGSALFGAAGIIVAIALTGGTDVPIVVIPVFASLMVLGSVASFELFSFLKEPKVRAEPILGMVKGGGMVGVRATF